MATAHTAVRPDGNTAGRLPDGTAARFNATADDCECCDDDGVPEQCCPCIYEVESLDITISGIDNDGCDDCTELNDVTFNIPKIDEFSCGGEEEIFNECGFDIQLHWSMHYVLGPNGVTTLWIDLWEVGVGSVVWFIDFPTVDGFTPIDCSQFNGSSGLPDSDDTGGGCDWSAATVSVVVNT